MDYNAMIESAASRYAHHYGLALTEAQRGAMLGMLDSVHAQGINRGWQEALAKRKVQQDAEAAAKQAEDDASAFPIESWTVQGGTLHAVSRIPSLHHIRFDVECSAITKTEFKEHAAECRGVAVGWYVTLITHTGEYRFAFDIEDSAAKLMMVLGRKMLDDLYDYSWDHRLYNERTFDDCK